MELVRSDSPEVVRNIASAGAWASRNWYTLGFACAANVLALLIALTVSLTFSVRAAAWTSVPVFLALNGYVLWRAQASHRRWVTVVCADRLYVRLFAWRSGDHGDVHEPEVLVLKASEIASISVRTIEVFLYGPKPKLVEWLVIEPAQAVAERVSSHIRPLLTATDQDKAVLVAHDQERLMVSVDSYLSNIPLALTAQKTRATSTRKCIFSLDLTRCKALPSITLDKHLRVKQNTKTILSALESARSPNKESD